MDSSPTHTHTQLSIYQVTDDGLCDELLSLSQSGINVTMIVSDYVLSGWKEAQVMYTANQSDCRTCTMSCISTSWVDHYMTDNVL